jgi:hypothetical protein
MYEKAMGFKVAGSDNSGCLTKALRSPSMAETEEVARVARPARKDRCGSRDEYTDIRQRFIAAIEGTRLTSTVPRS